MDQGNPPPLPPESQVDQASPGAAALSNSPTTKLVDLQRAFILDQLATGGAETQKAGDLNKRIGRAAQRTLQLTPKVANKVRGELANQHYLETVKKGRSVTFRLTEAGKSYLAGLERPVLNGPTRKPSTADEAAISDEVREAQKAFLLLQLLNADGKPLPKGNANKIREGLQRSLGLKPAVANYRRVKMAEQGFIKITKVGRGEEYTLLPDGLDYLAASARHLEHADFSVSGKTLNALVTAARESSFEGGHSSEPQWAERPMPSPSELAEAVLATFGELRSESYSRSGLVPIHEVRQRIINRFGPAAGRHDVLDKVILGLWQEKRLGLKAISDLADATEQQLNDSIQGVHGTLFYLELPREQSVLS